MKALPERSWQVLLQDEFVVEFSAFPLDVRRQIYALIKLLEHFGPSLNRPHVDTLKGSKYANMKELRFSTRNGEWRVAFAFDVKRQAILLVGGDKAGVTQSRFYRNLIGIAEERFRQHLLSLAEE
ncbi:type II toxin-antitoxin system RelE/ParE family toxin [Telmatobacter bradus]|uniref:type II toxin-antitoxin system RelE/ParE family toxin n=1 Tax=Telmatobacter bradus TaxID=474953 RepID=UPI003B437069